MESFEDDTEREFAYGFDLLNPSKAVNPELVYDASEKDYIEFLCKQGHNTITYRLISGEKSACRSTISGRGWDLNYPSLTLAVEDGHKIKASFFRTFMNVGSPKSIYHVRVNKPKLIDIKAEPSVLSTTVGEEKLSVVKVDGPNITQAPIYSASVTWEDGVHVVRSPPVSYTVLPQPLENNIENKPSSVPKAALAGAVLCPITRLRKLRML